jgi:hypothetical protein
MMGLKPILVRERAEEAASRKPKAARKVSEEHYYFSIFRDRL